MFTPGINELAHMVLPVAPLLGVYIVGLMLAATHRRRAPRAASLVFFAVSLMIVALVLQRLVYFGLPRLLTQQGWTPENIRWVFTAFGFVMSGMTAAGVLLLILAAFTWRRPEE